MNPAPIILFTYNRPTHTRRTLESLMANKMASDSELIIFSDGPKPGADMKKINEVREMIAQQTWCKKLTVHISEQNKGLANSVIEGVTQTLKIHERVIVLEDDMVLSPYFLEYMNEGLEKYKDEEEVISIHGYCFPIAYPQPFFLKGADCWGWGTWRRGWRLFNADSRELLQQIRERELAYDFDFDGTYPYTAMLQEQIKGRVDSWAIRWYASAYLQNKLTLYPGESLVQNIGGDGTGTHLQSDEHVRTKLSDHKITIGDIPVTDSVTAKQLYKAHYYKYLNLTGRLKKRFKWGY